MDTAESDYAAINDLVVNCPELAQLEEKLGGFNVFQVLKFEYGEIRHSNMLAWLLDPSESHGLDDLFLKKWLMRTLHELPEFGMSSLSPIDVDSWTLLNVEVRREWFHIDLLLVLEHASGEQWVVAIENKVKSTQHSNQLTRYREIVEKHFPRASQKLYLFLTKDPETPEDSAYLPSSYDQVHRALSEAIKSKGSSIGEEPAMLIRNYLTLLEEKFMNDSEVARIAQKIYQQHKRALDVIFEHRPDNLKLVSDELQRLLRENASELGIIPTASSRSYLRFVPSSWDVPQNTNGTAWGNCERTVLFEINLRGKSPYLLVIAGDAPKSWVEPIWEKTAKPPFNPGRRKKVMPKRWVTLHVHTKRLKLSEESLESTQDAVERIYKWIKDALVDKGMKEVISILAEEMKTLEVGSAV
ncbi:PD-(D/E)XK nuclease family protein [Pelagicoccus mobilis]|uniref:PD-(D/E)XK nuclease family protein n=1 Tax=Pelagicoccus mobilis TaxID=415221 RepID=A0A934S2Q4_9BACT|nr:PD-(D/E)XK nuclease family protein [Pelagicoccus mobilis]MBK1877968.1 PD-(D/E)XK nuclease family protein [Pelagicoccus mobilis]